MKFYSYNFVMNEASNNIIIIIIIMLRAAANIMLNEVPNCNDAMCIGNNLCLTVMMPQQFSMVAI